MAGKLAETLEWLMGIFASQSPGVDDDLPLIDATSLKCARSRGIGKGSAVGDAADHGYRSSHTYLPPRGSPSHRRLE